VDNCFSLNDNCTDSNQKRIVVGGVDSYDSVLERGLGCCLQKAPQTNRCSYCGLSLSLGFGCCFWFGTGIDSGLKMSLHLTIVDFY
jgi:hypothetical protein